MLGNIHGKLVPVPFNLNSIDALFRRPLLQMERLRTGRRLLKYRRNCWTGAFAFKENFTGFGGFCLKLITFAVPCYNSQAYMDHCISTLLACGGAEDIEIILVDDGST